MTNDTLLDIRRAITENSVTSGVMLAYLVEAGIIDKQKFDKLRSVVTARIDQEMAAKDHEASQGA